MRISSVWITILFLSGATGWQHRANAADDIPHIDMQESIGKHVRNLHRNLMD